jgi:MYXO-CTERM domain-containing protein
MSLMLAVASSAWADGLYQEAPADLTMTWIGSVTSEGDAVMNADTARTTYGVDGSGVNLAVISDSFDTSGSTPSEATQISNGDLPGPGNPNGYATAVNVLNDMGGGTDEGRAMLEIVHDVAPGAMLHFHSAFNNGSGAPSQTIADAINACSTAVGSGGIIVDDVGILTQARFQDGAAAQAYDAASLSSRSCFSSAGNSDNDATRAVFSGPAGGTVNWGTDDVLVTNFTGSGRLVVQWTDPYNTVSGPHTVTDFEVHITDATGTTTYLVIDNQVGSGSDPYEFVSITGPSGPLGIRVQHKSGSTDDMVQVSTFNGFSITDPDDTNAPTVFGHAAAAGSEAIAAHFHGTPGSVEPFSSRGPTDIYFDTAGNPVSESRPTPDITAPDGVSTTTSGFGTFFGTSAAAPHAAAVAALLQEHHKNLHGGASMTATEVYTVLEDTAVDIHAPGYDNDSGHGRIDAMAALDAITPEATVTNPGGTGSTYDFGNVRVGTTSAAHSIEVENTGGSHSELTGSFGSVANDINGGGGTFSLAQGATSSDSYTYTPGERGGDSKTVTVATNSWSGPGVVNADVDLTLEGTGVGPVFDSPHGTAGLLHFGTVLVGDTAGIALDPVNATTDGDLGALTDLTLHSMVLGDTTNFGLSGFTPASVLSAGDVLSMLVAFTPSAPGGYFTTLTITTDEEAPFGGSGNVYVFDLEGIGQQQPNPGDIVPEPAGLSIAALAALALRRRRRA